MSRREQPSIRSEGLRAYLDRTKDYHNGQDYDDLVFYLKHRVPFSAISRMFNISHRATINKWLLIYKEELGE
jgi:hypothetical protein